MNDCLVDFEPGYFWTCPSCGHLNVVRQYRRQLMVGEDEPVPDGAEVSADIDDASQSVVVLGVFECGPVRTTVHCLCCEQVVTQRPAPHIGEPS